MRGYILSSQEQAQLEKIDWLVLRPLYAFLQSVIGEHQSEEAAMAEFKRGFYQLDFLQIAFEQLPLSDQPEAFKPLISHLVMHLVKSKAPYSQHQKNLQALSQQASWEPLREAYLEILEKCLPSERQGYIESLTEIPN